jgi:hypothetical protein
MLDKNTLDSVYRNIADGGYLDDWVLNCARAMRDQAVAAIDLATENELLKAKLDALRWVPVSERKPTNADSDESGQVIAFSRFGCCIVHWTTLSTRTPFTHWRPLPPKPPESEG